MFLTRVTVSAITLNYVFCVFCCMFVCVRVPGNDTLDRPPQVAYQLTTIDEIVSRPSRTLLV